MPSVSPSCFSVTSLQVYPELSSKQILATEWINGITIDKVRGQGVVGVRT